MLVLPIKKEWFNMIASDEKKEEYREIKKYYNSRLGNYYINHVLDARARRILKDMGTTTKKVMFRNGYKYNDPHAICLCELRVGKGKEEWGALPNKEYYILKIKKICSINYGGNK